MPQISEQVPKLSYDRQAYQGISAYVWPVLTSFCRNLLLPYWRQFWAERICLVFFVCLFLSIYLLPEEGSSSNFCILESNIQLKADIHSITHQWPYALEQEHWPMLSSPSFFSVKSVRVMFNFFIVWHLYFSCSFWLPSASTMKRGGKTIPKRQSL